jgi:hypothetical protein
MPCSTIRGRLTKRKVQSSACTVARLQIALHLYVRDQALQPPERRDEEEGECGHAVSFVLVSGLLEPRHEIIGGAEP